MRRRLPAAPCTALAVLCAVPARAQAPVAPPPAQEREPGSESAPAATEATEAGGPEAKEGSPARWKSDLLGGDAPTRLRAAQALAAYPDPAAVPTLAEVVLRDHDARVREAAVGALASAGGSLAEAAIRRALMDQSEDVRWAAERALRKLPPSPPIGLPGLRDPDPSVRAMAARTLGLRRDAGAVPELVRILGGDPDASVREAAAWALGMAGDNSARESLDRAARGDESFAVRREAGSALAALAPPAPSGPRSSPRAPVILYADEPPRDWANLLWVNPLAPLVGALVGVVPLAVEYERRLAPLFGIDARVGGVWLTEKLVGTTLFGAQFGAGVRFSNPAGHGVYGGLNADWVLMTPLFLGLYTVEIGGRAVYPDGFAVGYSFSLGVAVASDRDPNDTIVLKQAAGPVYGGNLYVGYAW